MRVFIAGHTGLVGRALLRRLQLAEDYIVTHPVTRVDYRNPAATLEAIRVSEVDAVVIAAGKVGGIGGNIAAPADFTHDNASIQLNIIEAARACGVRKLIALGSSCIYPRLCKQPMCEEDFLTGPYEPTNRGYAVAKTLGIEMCRAYHAQHGCNFYALMPPNLYGPWDNFRPAESHVVAALLNRVSATPNYGELTVWGSGNPRREFMHADDLASAVQFCLNKVNAEHCGDAGFLNAGTGESCSIRELAELVIKASGKTVQIKHDRSKPDGMPNKLMNSDNIHNLGWRHAISLKDGLKTTWDWLLKNRGLKDVRV